MPESVSSDTLDSLAAKLADFADSLDDNERTALDLFFLQPTDVEGFSADGTTRPETHEEREAALRASLVHGLATYFPPDS